MIINKFVEIQGNSHWTKLDDSVDWWTVRAVFELQKGNWKEHLKKKNLNMYCSLELVLCAIGALVSVYSFLFFGKVVIEARVFIFKLVAKYRSQAANNTDFFNEILVFFKFTDDLKLSIFFTVLGDSNKSLASAKGISEAKCNSILGFISLRVG